MFESIYEKYPEYTIIGLKEDYPQTIHIVKGYHELGGSYYIDFEDETSVCVNRLDELMVYCKKGIYKRVKINLQDVRDACDFCEKINRFSSDINLIKDHNVSDAKSIQSTIVYTMYNEVIVEIISDDEEEIKQFHKAIDRFEVKQS